jgi:hypothetical protein
MQQRLVFTLILLLAVPALYAAQGSGGKQGEKKDVIIVRPGIAVPPPLSAGGKPLELPAGEDAWAIQVLTGGGFAGRGKGDVTVISDGAVVCEPSGAACVGKLSPEALQPLARSVLAAKPDKWGESNSLSACRDCYTTLLVLRRRGQGGTEEVFTARWDDVTRPDLPGEVKKIYERVVELTTAEK